MTSFPYSTSKLAKTFIPINQFVEKYFCYCRRPQKFKVGKTICKDEEMLQCVDCSELYHRICLPVTCSSNFKKKNSNWACPTYSIAWFTFYLPMKFLFSNTELYLSLLATWHRYLIKACFETKIILRFIILHHPVNDAASSVVADLAIFELPGKN